MIDENSRNDNEGMSGSVVFAIILLCIVILSIFVICFMYYQSINARE